MPVRTVTPQEALELSQSGTVRLIDVREDAEWAAGHAPGAIHAPLSRFQELAPTLPTDKPAVIYCLAGARSAKALGYLQSLGLPFDTHMPAGMSGWRQAGLPEEG